MEGKVNDLFDPAETIVELKTMNDEAAYEKLQQSGLQKIIQGKRNDCILLKLHRNEIPSTLRELMKMNVDVLSFHSKHSLEDYFLSLTAHPHVEALTN